jgi:predicted small secreted protein
VKLSQVVDSPRHDCWHDACNRDIAWRATRRAWSCRSINERGFIMKRMIALALATAYIFISGCNTIQGAGKDIERGGEKIQSEAQEAKKY